MLGIRLKSSMTLFLVHIDHDVTEQDERILRPDMIDEYAVCFQSHLQETYGKSYWQASDLRKWVEMAKHKFALKGVKLCRASKIAFDGSKPFTLGFQCSGAAYNKLGREIIKVAESIPSPMGRRPFPIPANSSVLVIGNSHTRQMVKTLVCQHSSSVVKYDDRLGFATARSDAFLVRFANNATLISRTNYCKSLAYFC